MSVSALNQAFPYEKPQVKCSEAPMFTCKHVYTGVFHLISDGRRIRAAHTREEKK